MKIGVVGAGNVGEALGRKWAAAGHLLIFGVREPEDPKYDELRSVGAVRRVEDAVRSGEVIVLALPGGAVADFAAALGGALAGKVVVDTTNNMGGAQMNSIGVLAEKAPGARLGRAFNSLGWENFAEPQVGGVAADLFFCSQPGARETIETLGRDVGLRPVYLGNVELAPALDGMTRLWFALAYGQGRGRRIAFKLLAESASGGGLQPSGAWGEASAR